MLYTGRKTHKQSIYVLLAVVFAISAVFIWPKQARAAEIKIGTVYGLDNDSTLNFRNGPGTGYGVIGYLSNGQSGEILGEEAAANGVLWYQMKVDDLTGWASSAYVQVSVVSSGQVTVPEPASDPEFEEYMSAWGFPESYKQKLRILHSLYPNWIFEAQHTGLKWADVIAAEGKVGMNLVHKSEVNSMKSVAEGAYDWNTGSWIEYDSGGWVPTSVSMVEYAMDPRNFLDETNIFQFIVQAYDTKEMTASQITQKRRELQKMVRGTYLAGDCEGRPYVDVIMDAAAQSGCCPLILASAMIQEQGIDGTGSSISGTVSGYENYYNYFNIGAYKSGSMSAVERGLWYASGSGSGATSYGRPWNTRQKAIIGGARYYSDQFVKRGQDTIYLKKFNVQGSSLYGHQYMTNVQGAIGEGRHVSKAYDASARKAALVFKIPVYITMPDTPYVKPTANPAPEAMIGVWKKNHVGYWYEYKDGTYPTGRWERVDGHRYYFNEYGYMQTGWLTLGESKYCLAESGAMRSGWQQIDNAWYYFSGDGVMKTGWQYIGRTWYFMEENGVWNPQKVCNQWIADHGGWVYQYADGTCPHDCWKEIAGKTYYFGSDGYRYIGWHNIQGVDYYFNKKGEWIPNAQPSQWIQNSTGLWYRYPDGTYPKEQWEEIDGKSYYFDERGYALIGWHIVDDIEYYFDSTGAMRTGWLWYEGSYYYLDSLGQRITGWLYDNGNWYFLNDNGVMLASQWIGPYYLLESGSMATSQWIGEYYVQENGMMATSQWIGPYYVGEDGRWIPDKPRGTWILNSVGWWYSYDGGGYPKSCWEKIGDKMYYFDASGYMKTGWLLLENTWYFLDASGAMVTDCWIGSYYLQSDGSMATSQWIGSYYVGANGQWIPEKQKGVWILNSVGWWYSYDGGGYPKNCWKDIDGKRYYFDAYGYMKTGWLYVDNAWYYLNASGVMVTDCWIGNCYIGSNGVWIP